MDVVAAIPESRISPVLLRAMPEGRSTLFAQGSRARNGAWRRALVKSWQSSIEREIEETNSVVTADAQCLGTNDPRLVANLLRRLREQDTDRLGCLGCHGAGCGVGSWQRRRSDAQPACEAQLEWSGRSQRRHQTKPDDVCPEQHFSSPFQLTNSNSH